MYKIKQKPEDFIVKEISNVEIGSEGVYSYFVLKKKNYTTLRAVQHIAKVLGVGLKDMGFAGSKDKNAITEQVVSVKNVSEDRLSKIELKDISIKFLGKGKKPVSLGELEGNYFKIVVNCDNAPKKIERFRNLFGEQRFSTKNTEIGRAIVKKEFGKAASLVMETDNDEKNEMEEHLKSKKNDFVGALMKIPSKKLKMYVHAYQSFLWNKMAVDSDEEEIPIIGFGTEENKEIEKVLAEEGITTRDFIIREMRELSSEGDARKVFVDVKDLKIKKKSESKDSDNAKQASQIKEKVFEIEFILPKGCYATELIRQMLTE